MSMVYKNRRPGPDLFSLLLVAVALGMSVTLAYQVNVYYGGGTSAPIAGSGQSPRLAD